MDFDNLEMDIFLGDDMFEGNEELSEELDRIKPSEADDESPESVASDNKIEGQNSTNSPLDVDDEDDDDAPVEGDDDTPTSLYSSLANVLYNEGVLPNLDLEKHKIESIDDLTEAIKQEIKQNEYGSLNERQRRYLEALEAGVPEELFLETEKLNYSLENVTEDFLEDEENVEFRTNLIKEYFLLRGFEEEEAESLAQQQVDVATDIEFSKKALQAIKTYNNSRLQEQIEASKRVEQEKVQAFNKLKETIEKTDSIIDGMSINKKDKQEILNIIQKPVATLEDGTQLNEIMKLQREDPIGFQHKIAYMIYMTKGLKDFSNFTSVKKAKSSAVKQLENVLKKSTLDLSGGDVDDNSIDFGEGFMLDLD